MVLFNKTKDLYRFLKDCPRPGFVPTMGNLHQGHLSLIEKSLQENKITVVSIFINPKQFSQGEDFHKYPKTLEDDLEKLKKTENKIGGTIVTYAPETDQEVFPKGFLTVISVSSLSQKLCGKTRKGHFDGVATVVCRLFSLINPQKAYFGMKDYQQYLIIKQMVKDLNFDIKLTALPIIRNEHGLALSSRNSYLNNQEKKQALLLPNTLNYLRKLTCNTSITSAREYIKNSTLNTHWDYLGIYDLQNLEELKGDYLPPQYLLAGALYVGKARLIDNLIVKT